MDLSTRQGRREQGQRLQRAVERVGLSIEELAGRVGCSRALIYQYVSGTTLAQPDRLQQIAAVCGVPLAHFYVEEEPTASTFDAERRELASAVVLQLPPQDVSARVADSLRALHELAAAQDSPPDYRGLASTCERILLLAEQQGDRAVQARAQFSLGRALNNIGDSPRAVEALTRAVALGIEVGDVELEISARQGLGKALVMLGRTADARAQFQKVADGPSWDHRWRGAVSLGSIHEQQGEYQAAMERFDDAAAILEDAEARRLATPQEVAVALLFINANRRNVYFAGGDFAEARVLAEAALQDAEVLGNAGQNLAARFDLAWCGFFTGRWAEAYQNGQTMLQLARFVGDQGRETRARAGLGIFLAAAGDHDSAIAFGKDALATALSRGDRLAELYAQLALADAYTGIADRTVEAYYHANQALAITSAVHYARTEIECRLRLARLNARTRNLRELDEAADRARGLAERLGARHLEALGRCWQVAALLLRAEATAIGTLPSELAADHPQSSPEADWLERARAEARVALDLANGTDFVEACWRSQYLLGRIEEVAGNMGQAEEHYLAAIGVFEALRSGLIQAGLPDTLLENDDCLAVYEALIRLLLTAKRAADAGRWLDQAGWPPLSARLASLFTD